MANIRFVSAIASTGNWLRVRLEDNTEVSLPYGLAVDVTGRTGGREQFTILEGVNKGKRASVVQKAGGSYLVTGLRHLPAAIIRFDSKSQRLTFGGRGPINAFSGSGTGVENGRPVRYTPVPPGVYDLAIPAYPSAQTRAAYGEWTAYHKTWFRIGLDTRGSRFLHAGEISDGCVTLRQFLYDGRPGANLGPSFADLPDIAQTSNRGLIGLPLPPRPVAAISYTDVYHYLILRRLNDQAVGRLHVTNTGIL